MYNKQNRKFVNMYGVMIPSHKRGYISLICMDRTSTP